jgi:hypothetical protein
MLSSLKSRPDGIPQAENFEIVAAKLPERAERQLSDGVDVL